MKKNSLERAGRMLCYLFLILLAVFMIYPLLWLAGSAFKSNQEIIRP